MKVIGNILWLIFGGLEIAFFYYLVGLLMCITIIGIPFGVQLFKLGNYVMWPFGREMQFGEKEPGCLSIAMNIIWILGGFWEVAAIHIVCGLLFCITIVGIPLGVQHFKMIPAAAFPFGQHLR